MDLLQEKIEYLREEFNRYLVRFENGEFDNVIINCNLGLEMDQNGKYIRDENFKLIKTGITTLTFQFIKDQNKEIQ
ncbi:MAG: hypothetical protein ACE5RH_03415 [Nitrosarchaeum sp.]